METAINWSRYQATEIDGHIRIKDDEEKVIRTVPSFWREYAEVLDCSLSHLYKMLRWGMTVEGVATRPRSNRNPKTRAKGNASPKRVSMNKKKAEYLRTHLERFGNTVISAKHSKEDIEQILGELGISAEVKWSEGESDRFGSTGGCWVIERKGK